MSDHNPLHVRRVLIQTVDAQGHPQGPPRYVVAASLQEHVDTNLFSKGEYESLEALNAAITAQGSILKVADPEKEYFNADHRKIGTDNYYGSDWFFVCPKRSNPRHLCNDGCNQT
jgi:hypothetical protein